ncbi:MAG TPA: glycosyltransferase family 2 protein [Gaiellaceae bacterium]|jgi:GT2 family glycosyltransferase|nr:glycosyltransferase family 2 protein [Gaiellaceae bacterium]
MDAALVSIVTPCLNPGERLVRCLDSVAAQTYPHVEHLVIDGGSTDSTVELLRERGIRFVSEPDRGQTDAINKGFALGRGAWLGWLNADDVLMPQAVELALVGLEAVPSAGWAYGDNDLWRDGDRRESTSRPPAHVDASALENGNLIPQAGSVIARWALDRIGPLDEELDLAMDYDLWLRLIDAGVPGVYVPDTLAAFELHGESKSGSIDRSEFRLEWARVLLKSGRGESAALMLGRAAAAAAQPEGRRIEPSRLEDEIARMTALVHGMDVRTVRVSAYAEAALLELHLRPRGFRYLLRPEAWSMRDTRGRLAGAFARGLARRLVKR